MLRQICRSSSPTIIAALLASGLWVGSPSLAAEPRSEFPAQVSRSGKTEEELATIEIGRKMYRVELARTPAAQMKGLMFRRALAADSGMLFVFADEIQRSFWMKNTLLPLDIIFITRDRTIDSFHTMSPCPGDPCPTYRSAGRVMYALELNAGEISRNRFRVGDKVSITIPSKSEARQ